MKTTIQSEIELPEQVLAVARREALRRGVPISVVLSEWVLERATAITTAEQAGKAAA